MNRAFRLSGLFGLAFAITCVARAEPLSLEDCLREVAAKNPAIIAARLEIERATGQRLILRSRALATFNIAGTAGYQGAQDAEDQSQRVRQPDGSIRRVQTLTQRKAQLIAVGTEDLEQPIFDAAIPASWRRGDLGILLSQQNYYTIAVAELYQARANFYRSTYYRDRAAQLRRASQVLADDTRSIQALVSGGLKARSELLAAQVREANFTPNVKEAEGLYHYYLALMMQEMGRQTPKDRGGSDSLDAITLQGDLVEHGLSFDAAAVGRQALSNRPDIRALRASASAAREDANITRGGYFPRVRLYIAGELIPQTFVRSNRPNAIRSSDQVQTTEIRPGVHGEWNIIDTGSVRGEARRIDASRGEIEITLHKLEMNLPSELAGVRAAINESVGSLEAWNDNVDAAQNTLNIVAAGVAQGNNSQLEFLDAQNGLLLTQLGIIDARLALSMARNDFDRITGRFMHYADTAPPAGFARSQRK